MIPYFIISALLILVDQVVKWWTVQTIPLNSGIGFIDGVISFFYLQNTGAAWGIFSGRMIFFYAITVVAVVAMVYLMVQEKGKSKLAMTSYALILSGAIGNFIDRVRLGYVVDMIRFEFIDFPIFNVADMCLTIGVALLFVYILLIEGRNKKGKE